ncbi:MAG: P-II family nitrogen regulator [Candidatus Omnitrophica bacterium]|jgi:nitrogen regulatory protein P-II 1|nr:P-II family nitrogen regulator [Candidatus Omnitrophota bacterium]MDD5661033.1 P-II family nitrogen regulator [Candidatus Omnitrophota bacterium]
MKKIEAIIRPESVDCVRNALSLAGVTGIMISGIEGHGKQKGVVQQWRGEKYKVELLPKTKIEIIVKDEDLKRISKVIIDSAKTGEIGDGKIFVYPVEDAIRIRTGENGDNAV